MSKPPILDYASPRPPSRGRFNCLWVVVPFIFGCIAGVLLIGGVVWCLGGYIIGIVELPHSAEEGFVLFVIVSMVVFIPPVLVVALIELMILVLVRSCRLQRRRWWVAALAGAMCPCLPIGLSIRPPISKSYYYERRVRIDDNVAAIAIPMALIAPLFLVKRARNTDCYKD